MHEQAEVENDRPFLSKKERRQTQANQGPVEKEPVTRSPFRREMAEADINKLDPVMARSPLADTTAVVFGDPATLVEPITVSAPIARSPTPTPASTARPPTPTRSSLVSRRLHGPRTSNGSSTTNNINGVPMMTARRARRKTVTFDERCDVVEFEREEHEDEGDDSRDVFFESDDDQDDSARVQRVVRFVFSRYTP
jgi:hypothetical protein